LNAAIEEREIKHFHLFCGLGGGALGFNRGRAELNGMRARFRCIGGVDVSHAAIRDFERLSGVRGTVLDMFDREQYRSFHEEEPPSGWREATPQDIHRAAGYERPNIVFLSAPCKGFSGLLSESRSKSNKYQALNRLTLRGIFLMLEAWAEDPPELVIFENVPRIATRGRALLDQINKLLHHYGYAVAETFHDCGEVGGLAQSRKRFLLVARHVAKVPPFLYEPPKRPLRAVGEILEKMPLPGDMRGGPMHSVPNLQWKTWVRLAFVEAGSDWRSLNKLRVVDGKLADYLLAPDGWHNCTLGVNKWDEAMGTVTGNARPMTGSFSVADPRHPQNDFSALSVERWHDPSGTVTGQRAGNNLFIADPRVEDRRSGVLGVHGWNESSGAIAGESLPPNGAFAVADPRHTGPAKFNDRYRVVRYDGPAQAVTGASGQGQCVADPRFPNSQGEHGTKYHVQIWSEPSDTITGSDRVGSGALCIADPRLNSQNGRSDLYGVTSWNETSSAVIGHASHDNGRFSVADPRLPDASQKLVAIIRALDGTWHRPFTTLELAALQSLVDPDVLFDLDGDSDSAKRERIGNAVPPYAAQAIADVMGQTLLMAWSGQSFMLSAMPIWVQPIAVALSVKTPEGRDADL
jgi:site-specific DNA-cytosine methylase